MCNDISITCTETVYSYWQYSTGMSNSIGGTSSLIIYTSVIAGKYTHKQDYISITCSY